MEDHTGTQQEGERLHAKRDEKLSNPISPPWTSSLESCERANFGFKTTQSAVFWQSSPNKHNQYHLDPHWILRVLDSKIPNTLKKSYNDPEWPKGIVVFMKGNRARQIQFVSLFSKNCLLWCLLWFLLWFWFSLVVRFLHLSFESYI